MDRNLLRWFEDAVRKEKERRKKMKRTKVERKTRIWLLDVKQCSYYAAGSSVWGDIVRI